MYDRCHRQAADVLCIGDGLKPPDMAYAFVIFQQRIATTSNVAAGAAAIA